VRISLQRDDRKPLLHFQWHKYISGKLTSEIGLVGGCIILHLLARGQPPESIRLVDFRPPVRADLLDNDKVSKVQFVQADITSETSTNEAFSKPWPKSVSRLPLTVFHTAAVINPSERAESLLYRCSAVNTAGTIHVINAAKTSGADVFIATSSGSVDMRRVDFWIAPWTKWPRRYVQTIGDVDSTLPVRSHKEYFGNYAVSKAVAEKSVLNANSPTFRTGCIRPTNGIYGNRYDHTLGTYMSMGKVPT
jgi:nucleoside-diphosphate-sugar epimerase